MNNKMEKREYTYKENKIDVEKLSDAYDSVLELLIEGYEPEEEKKVSSAKPSYTIIFEGEDRKDIWK